MSYKPDVVLQEYVDKNDVSSLSYALLTYLSRNDLPDDEALKAARWCQERLPGAFQETNSRIPFPKDAKKGNWTSDYYFHHVSYAESNFSMERFEHLVEVRNYLRAQNNELFTRIITSEESQKYTKESVEKKSHPPIAMILLGVIIVIAIAIVL